MKKFLSKIMFAAVAILSATGFTSCNNADDDPYVPTQASVEEQTQVVKEARYEANISEAAFKYANFTVTLEYNGQKQTYKFDESTKRDKVYFDAMQKYGLEPNMAARVIDIPFQYDAKRMVKATLSYELTEAGKQLIANAEKGQEIDLAVKVLFGNCDKTGKILYNGIDDDRAFPGTYVNGLDGFFNMLVNNFTQTLY